MAGPCLYLVRHGETVWNREGRLQGQRDSPLTERGRLQARRHGRLLRALVDDPGSWCLLASPLGRALATARAISLELGLPARAIVTDERLKEISYGAWEGLTRDEIDARQPGAWAARLRDHWRHVPPGGESYEQVAARAAAILHGIGRDTIVVGHGGVGRVLRGLYGRLSEGETLALDEPQDAFFRLAHGRIVRIDHAHAGCSMRAGSSPS